MTRGPHSEREQLLEEIAGSFAAAGHPVERDAETFVTADGRRFESRPILLDALAAPTQQRAEVIRQHVATLLSDDDADALDALGVAAALKRAYPRLLPANSTLAGGVPTVRVSDSLVAALVLELDRSVRTLSRADFDRLGGSETVTRAAYENLRALALPEPAHVFDGELDYFVLADDSVHVASLALEPALLCERVNREAGTAGVLLVAPNRHVVAWHVVRDAAVLSNINALVAFARQHYAAAAYAVSDALLWWDGAHLHDVASWDVSGQIVLSPPRSLGEVLTELINGMSD